MKARDFLWCAVNLVLDREEELNRLCPSCRAQAEEARCLCCGAPLDGVRRGGAVPLLRRAPGRGVRGAERLLR